MKKIVELFQAGLKSAAVRKVAVPAVVAVPALSVSTGAHAGYEEIKAAITAAVNNGSLSYELVITGVITAAAFGFCVGMVVSWLRK